MKFKVALSAFIISLLFGGTAFASPTLSMDSKGNEVLTLQKKLYLIGYEITEFDGVYGEETERAVSKFQKDHKITVTGIVTNVTWRALRKEKDKKGRVLPKITVTPTARKKTANESFGNSYITGVQANAIISTARNFMGVPYVFGGTTPSGFDCSGLIQYVFKLNGVDVPRLADEQYLMGKAVSRNNLQAGDLVFFTTYTSGVSHCGIYVGNGQFLHASSSKGVRIDRLDDDYWRPRYIGARKVVKE